MRVAVLTTDKYLLRFAELLFGADAEVTDTCDGSADVLIHDVDSGLEITEQGARVIAVSRLDTPGAERLPIARERLRELVLNGERIPRLSLSRDGKGAVMKGKLVKLTAHEFSLLSLLIEGGAEFTSREKISERVWGGASDGLINIYVHYLREKLETDGEKIIISSRKYGYRINPLYIGVADTAPSVTE